MQMRNSVLAIAAVWMLAPAEAPAQPKPQPATGPAIRTTVTEVVLDIVVRDRRGKIVKNLKPGEVEIYEDGVRQEIRSFRFADGGSRDKKGAGGGSRSASPGVQPLRAVNLVGVVFHNIHPTMRPRALEAAKEFLDRDFPEGTYAGMFQLDDRLVAVYPFTNRRDELTQAAARAFSLNPVDFGRASEAVLTANPNQMTIAAAVDMGGRSATVTARLSGGELSRTANAGAEVSTGAGASALRGDQVTERRDFSNISSQREMDSIRTMISQLGGLPGRKTVLLISGGLTTGGDPERFEAILKRTNEASMTVYALDVAGLDQNSTVQAGNTALGQVASVSRGQTSVPRAGELGLGAAKERSRMGDTMADAVRSSDTQAGLRALSEGSGGFLIANTDDYRRPFQRVTEDLDQHYETVYRPVSDKYDGRLRKIEVKVSRPDHSVDSRNGYFAMPAFGDGAAVQAHEVIGLAVLNSSPPAQAFDFRAAQFGFGDSQGSLVFEIPGDSLQVAARPERKTHVAHLSLLALVKDAGGQVVDKFSVDAPFEVPDANLDAVRKSAVMYSHAVNLPPGRYKVETAVVDREGRRAATKFYEFEHVPRANEVGMSSVVLIQRVEPVAGTADAADPLIYQGRRLVPYIQPVLEPGTNPYAYFVVYPGPGSEKPTLLVEFLVNGSPAGQQTANLPAPDASGTIPMMVKTPTRSGECELRLTAVQGTQRHTQSVRYTVR